MLVAEASAGGLFVMAHAQATEGIKNAIRAGIRSIEHGIYLDDEAIQMMLDAGTYLVPTLMAPQGVLDAADRGIEVPQYALDKARVVVDEHRRSCRRAVEAGVKIAMGTDSGVTPHGQNLDELPLMQETGMSPTQVWEASTRVAAELMGLGDRLGTLEPGKLADIAVWNGSSEEVASLSVDGLADRIDIVVQGGVPVA